MAARGSALAGFIAVSCLVAATAAARPAFLTLPGERPDDFKGDIWALLIAGSAGWGNYRHQADVLHAYQVLRHGGVKEDNIVVMVQDDLIDNPFNPHPGKIFNRPGGSNVAAGVKPDYTGAAVNSKTFLSVLQGEQTYTAIGSSGKTIKSGPEDRVFVYFADHGAPGILGMPNGAFLYADELLGALANKSAANGFRDMVLYIEACESGSIFEGMLDDSMDIYATTASNAYESSWGTYCPGMDRPPPPEFTTCLGDLYSVAFLENSERYDLREESLDKQYQRVRRRTSNNGTYAMGSHVMQYGSLTIDAEPVADYLGAANTGDGSAENGLLGATDGEDEPVMGALPQREADLLPLWLAVQRAAPGAPRAAARAELAAVLDTRRAVDEAARGTMAALLSQPAVLAALQAKYAYVNLLLPAAALQDSNAAAEVAAPVVEQFVSAPLPRAAGLPLVDDWSCLRAMVGAWEAGCGKLDQYGMQYTRLFANLCNAGIGAQDMATAAARTCRASALAA
ncbi:hypothetical protein WJX81_000515 [Elliptochloris bilobata]|uniref:legumain n=1 Tax=Elliptochloris bilobata TaxID=381761 RepID=A0AAW1SBA8_9CHLO